MLFSMGGSRGWVQTSLENHTLLNTGTGEVNDPRFLRPTVTKIFSGPHCVLDSRPKGRGFEPHRRHYVVSLSKNINPSLVLVQPRKTRPFITERLLMGRKESNQTFKKQTRTPLTELFGSTHVFHTDFGFCLSL